MREYLTYPVRFSIFEEQASAKFKNHEICGQKYGILEMGIMKRWKGDHE